MWSFNSTTFDSASVTESSYTQITSVSDVGVNTSGNADRKRLGLGGLHGRSCFSSCCDNADKSVQADHEPPMTATRISRLLRSCSKIELARTFDWKWFAHSWRTEALADRLSCTAVGQSVKQVALIIELLNEQTRLQIRACDLADKISASICIGEAHQAEHNLEVCCCSTNRLTVRKRRIANICPLFPLRSPSST